MTHLAIPLVQLDVARARVRELPADKEAGRRERVRVGERDAPELCGHGEVYGGDEVKNVINVGDDTLFTSRHCMLYTHHTTDNVQQGIYRQDGHGPAGERAAVSMHACMHAAATLLNAHNSAVLYKLILFALLMAVVPIATYFGTLNYLWQGASCYARSRPPIDPSVYPGACLVASFLLISVTLRRLDDVGCHLGHRCCQSHPRRIRRCCLSRRCSI